MPTIATPAQIPHHMFNLPFKPPLCNEPKDDPSPPASVIDLTEDDTGSRISSSFPKFSSPTDGHNGSTLPATASGDERPIELVRVDAGELHGTKGCYDLDLVAPRTSDSVVSDIMSGKDWNEEIRTENEDKENYVMSNGEGPYSPRPMSIGFAPNGQ